MSSVRGWEAKIFDVSKFARVEGAPHICVCFFWNLAHFLEFFDAKMFGIRAVAVGSKFCIFHPIRNNLRTGFFPLQTDRKLNTNFE